LRIDIFINRETNTASLNYMKQESRAAVLVLAAYASMLPGCGMTTYCLIIKINYDTR
jgi:hypothetical protein